MALCKYTTDRIRTRKAIAKVIKLWDKIYRSSGTLSDAKYTKASDRLQYLLLLLRYRDVDTLRLWPDTDHPLTMRPFFKGQNNQKLCLSFCHCPTLQVSFALFIVLNSGSFLSVIPSPKHSQCIKPLQYLCWLYFLLSFLLACP